MLTRRAVAKEYKDWIANYAFSDDGDISMTPEEAAQLPPREQTKFYIGMRNRVLRFSLIVRMAADAGLEKRCEGALGDLQHAMIGLRSWYYARPKLH